MTTNNTTTHQDEDFADGIADEDEDVACCVRCANRDKIDLFDALEIGHNDHTPTPEDATPWDTP
jgi:hypothetical protein